jgi:putative spermidine/putrescine transport system substrate-binding protein
MSKKRRPIKRPIAAIAHQGRRRAGWCVDGFASHHRLPGGVVEDAKVLRHLGTAVNQSADSAKKVKEDTGIIIEYVAVTTDDVTKRVITQPNSYDIVDTEYFRLKKLVPSGNLSAMDAKKIKNFDKITPVFTKGELPNGKKIGGQVRRPGR